MNLRKFYANKDNATFVDLTVLAAGFTGLMCWMGAPLLVAIAVSLTCVCVSMLAGIAAEVFGWHL